MPNLALSQGTATAHFDRFLLPDRLAELLTDVLNLLTTSSVYIRQDGGYTTAGARQIVNLSLSGVVLGETGRNTDAGGRLWVRLTANGGNWDIHIYKAMTAQAGDEVATASDIADDATFTLTAANSSGITGSGKLTASVAAIAADNYALQCYVGFAEYARQVFNGTQQEDGDCLKEFTSAVGSLATSIEGAIARLNRLNEKGAFLKQTGRIWQAPSDEPFLNKKTENNDDVISVLADGVFERMRNNWDLNTTEQKVAVNTIAAAAVTEQVVGGGDIAVTFGTPGPNLEPGLLQGVCVEDTLPNQRFKITFTPTDGTGPISGRNLLTVGKVWDDPDIPIQVTAVNVYAKGGADGGDDNDVAAANLCQFINPTADNTIDGLLYWKVTGSTGAWITSFYKDSGFTQLVAVSPATAANAAYTATQQNRSGLTVTWTVGSAPTTAANGTIDMQPLKKGSSTTVPDQFTSVISRSALGRIQDSARRYHGWKYFQGSGPTFADTFIDKGARWIDGHL